METLILTEEFILNSDFTIILPHVRVKNTEENIELFFSEYGRSIIFGYYSLKRAL